MEVKASAFVRIGVEVIYPLSIESRRTTDQPMHLIALAQEQLCQIGAVLASDSGDERYGGHKRTA